MSYNDYNPYGTPTYPPQGGHAPPANYGAPPPTNYPNQQGYGYNQQAHGAPQQGYAARPPTAAPVPAAGTPNPSYYNQSYANTGYGNSNTGYPLNPSYPGGSNVSSNSLAVASHSRAPSAAYAGNSYSGYNAAPPTNNAYANNSYAAPQTSHNYATPQTNNYGAPSSNTYGAPQAIHANAYGAPSSNAFSASQPAPSPNYGAYSAAPQSTYNTGSAAAVSSSGFANPDVASAFGVTAPTASHNVAHVPTVPCSNGFRNVARTATLTWSPSAFSIPFLATGTVAGALDASFSTTTVLEIFDLNLLEHGVSRVKRIAQAPSASRFHRLSWSQHGSGEYGLIAGGLENGSLELWNPSEMISYYEEDELGTQVESKALVMRSEAHKGGVRGLDFNPFQQNLLATGAADAEIFIWDLQQPDKPYSPGTKSQRLEDISILQWNHQVPHILATASQNGQCVIWDLRQLKEVIHLSASPRRMPCSSVVWHPHVGTQLLTASEDDSQPVIQGWDLRNAHSPEKSLSGHAKSILSMSWCGRDDEMLVSSGKDNRLLVWNPRTTAMIGEFPSSTKWTFDVQWCHRHPDFIACSSFEGQVRVHSLQGEETGTHAPDGTAHFHKPVQQQTPKWFCRPCGATWGFGGKLISFHSKRFLSVRTVLTEAELVQRAVALNQAVEQKRFIEYCERHLQDPSSSSSIKSIENVWCLLKLMFERDPRQRVLALLGFDRDEVVQLVQKKVGSTPSQHNRSASVNAANHGHEEFPGPTENVSFTSNENDFHLMQQKMAQLLTSSLSSHDTSSSATSLDQLITRALIVGDFESAVQLALHANRLSDALVLALCGGEDLLVRTRQAYFMRRSEDKVLYLPLMASIANDDFSTLIEHGALTEWKQWLAVLCTFAKSEQFSPLTCRLAERLEWNKDISSAISCYVIAGHVEKVSNLLLSLSSMTTETLMEQLTILRRAIDDSNAGAHATIQEPLLVEHYLSFSERLAHQGCLDLSLRTLQFITLDESSPHMHRFLVLRDRVYRALVGQDDRWAQQRHPEWVMHPAPVFPFTQQTVSHAQNNVNPPNGYAPTANAYAAANNYTAAPPAANGYVPSANNYSAPAVNNYSVTPTATAAYAPPSNNAASSFAPPLPSANAYATSSNYAPPQMTKTSYAPPANPSSFASPPATANSTSYAPPPTTTNPSSYAPPTTTSYAPPSNSSSTYPPTNTSNAGYAPSSTNTAYAPPAANAVNTGGFAPPVANAANAGYANPPANATNSGYAPPVTTNANYAPPTSNASAYAPPATNANYAPPATNASAYATPATNANYAPPATNSSAYAPPAAATTSFARPQPLGPTSSVSVPPPPAIQAPNTPQPSQQYATANVAPVTEKPRHPPGDRSHIPQDQIPIMQSLQSLLQLCQQRAPPQNKRIVEDAEKRIAVFLDQLNNGEITGNVISTLLSFSSLLDAFDYAGASQVQVQLMTRHYSEVGHLLMGVKRLIEMARHFA